MICSNKVNLPLYCWIFKEFHLFFPKILCPCLHASLWNNLYVIYNFYLWTHILFLLWQTFTKTSRFIISKKTGRCSQSFMKSLLILTLIRIFAKFSVYAYKGCIKTKLWAKNDSSEFPQKSCDLAKKGNNFLVSK